MEVLLDTNFILSCLRKRIDFIEQLREQGFKILIPKEVLEELKNLKLKPETSTNDRSLVNIAIEFLDSQKISKTKLGSKTVDEGLVKKGREGAYIATLDKAVQRVVPNIITIFNSKKSVGIKSEK